MPRCASALLLATLYAAITLPAHAQALRDDARGIGAYVQAGKAADRADSLTAGVLIPWRWTAAGGALTGYWDVFASHWRVDGNIRAQGGSITQVGVLPTLRYRFDAGRSPWFVEAGTLGLTFTDSPYQGRYEPFSTRFNFASHAGLGYSFGAQAGQEIGLRVQHVSNAGIDKPNPGENFLQLRYGWRF